MSESPEGAEVSTGLACLQARSRAAHGRVQAYLQPHGVFVPEVTVRVDAELPEGTVAVHVHPASIVLRSASVPESVMRRGVWAAGSQRRRRG